MDGYHVLVRVAEEALRRPPGSHRTDPSLVPSVVALKVTPAQQADRQRNSRNKYIKNYDFAYQLPPPLGGRGDADFTVTAVLGHLTSSVR